jgi:hypothetical protein
MTALLVPHNGMICNIFNKNTINLTKNRYDFIHTSDKIIFRELGSNTGQLRANIILGSKFLAYVLLPFD